MKKAGVRPKAFRSRLLIYVPLVLALYMFVWPVFYRLALAPFTRPDLQWPGFSTHFTTTDFWRTFPGVLVAIPFLLVCGFAAVYFLGAKGYCTYGCPYGGFFAPLDEFSPGRIRVTDACERCGHCTAVCTSNVRVHEEVREYGMVVDPGCMKCLDCVSVCPNDALYFGFGRPAHLKGPARQRTPKHVYDLTWPEEIGFAVLFAVVFFVVRGLYGLIPMLMAAGIAGVVTFMGWKLWRLCRDRDVRFHRFQLRRADRTQPAGRVYAAVTVAVLVLCLHSGLVSGAEGLGWLHYQKLAAGGDVDVHGQRAERWFGLAASITEGGIGLASNLRLDLKRARVARLRGETDEALALYERVLSTHRDDVHIHEEVIPWLLAQGRLDEGIDLCRSLRDGRDDVGLLRWESLLLNEAGRLDETIEVCRLIVGLEPDNPAAHASLAFALAQRGDRDEALAAARRAVELEPEDPEVRARVQALIGTLAGPEPRNR
jgi:ferredoxin